VAEIIYSWRGDNGPTKIITVLGYDESGITFNAWDASDSLSTVLSPGEWHEVTVEADSDQKTQKLLIDGEQVAELTAVNADAVADTMIIGDVAGQAFQALHTYDDVSLDTHACSGAPAQETDSPVASGAAPAISEKDGGGFPWWIIVVIVIVGAIVVVLFWRRRRSRPAE